MNDKQQLAAMGEHLSEQLPMCMAKRIEELEAQLAEKSIKVERLREMNLIAMKRVDGMLDRDLELSRLQSLMQEGWKLVPVEPGGDGSRSLFERWFRRDYHPDRQGPHIKDITWAAWQAALAAAPSPDGTK